ncbi:MAG: heme ABC transporter ATP-binding protein, partial [Propionibacterium sp.]
METAIRGSEASKLAPKLKLRGITKRFGSLVANDHIDLDVIPGRIHCLLGENGAGKSTLMNQLYGLLTADEGEILIGDQPQNFDNPKQAIAAGIGMVHQHFMLVQVFTVAENIALGREPGSAGLLDMNAAREQVRELSKRYNLDVDPDAVIEELPVGIQQRVEILKALANDATYLVFDEPTAVLTPQEIDELMAVMERLRDEGKAIVFITHKLREVRAVADDVTVIRRGKVVGQAEPGMSEAELAAMMVGREVSLSVDKKPAETTDVRLKVEDLEVLDSTGAVKVDGVSFDVHGGEILCIAGVQGNGQTELAQALLGIEEIHGGKVLMDDVDITNYKPKRVIEAGMGFVPEDRQLDGFVKNFTIAENLILNRADKFANAGNLRLNEVSELATELVETYDIRTPSITTHVGSLSGGNQQKVVLARELSRKLSVIVANQPTRGVDVGAIEFLHKRIVQERDSGV